MSLRGVHRQEPNLFANRRCVSAEDGTGDSTARTNGPVWRVFDVAAGSSLRRREARERREVPHVAREQVHLEEKRRRGDEVVGAVDPALRAAVLP